jgi:hypothetical protein
MTAEMPVPSMAELEKAQRAWEKSVLHEIARAERLLLSEGNSDAATEAAEALWCMMDDYHPFGGRRELLWWCYFYKARIGRRPFSRVLAMTWCRPKVASLIRWGFPLSVLKKMFAHAAPEHLMEPEDLVAFNGLPAEVVAYRGCSGATIGKARYGMSWTLDQATAIWFAQRCPEWGAPLCIRATIRKGDVLAYFDEGARAEKEIVVLPGHVSRVEPISLA